MARTLRDEEANRRHGLQTVLRYQSEAMNGFNRALRALTQLRQGRAEPQVAPPPANQNLPAEPAPAVPTNEPEPVAGSAVAAPPPDAEAAKMPIVPPACSRPGTITASVGRRLRRWRPLRGRHHGQFHKRTQGPARRCGSTFGASLSGDAVGRARTLGTDEAFRQILAHRFRIARTGLP